MTPRPPTSTLFPYTMLFRSYRQVVYRAAYTVTGRRQDAEDVLQTLFLRLLDQGFGEEFISNPAGYLYRSAMNERSEEHTSELQSHSDLVCRLLLEKKKDIQS